MKKSGATVAVASSAAALIVAASYSAALSDSFADPKSQCPSQPSEPEEQRRSSPAADRFAPRFDGLRFIETLVTAHR
ncbi:uncharacterized protein [Elaeis guineensis]|uniref:Uncharacterized protein LOC105038370 n=1 Tax=Elaeis guineensis var. tenera TaxID=51953 RepID=A0A6I9QS61_ELAGV|nr:uncharacterized protein LOC105038370 [Elaeis guineensis]